MAEIVQNGNRWDVSGDVAIDSVTGLLNASKALTIVDNAVVDFAKVAEIDTGAISLILEWRRRANAEKKHLEFVNLPANLTSLTQLYGVDDLIN